MKTSKTQPTALHHYYKLFLSENGIGKNLSIEIEDLMDDDIVIENNYDLLMKWFNWIFDKIKIDSTLRFANIVVEGKMIGIKIKDAFQNEFTMLQRYSNPLSHLTDDQVIDMCIETKDHTLTQDSNIYYWYVDYKYASKHYLN